MVVLAGTATLIYHAGYDVAGVCIKMTAKRFQPTRRYHALHTNLRVMLTFVVQQFH